MMPSNISKKFHHPTEKVFQFIEDFPVASCLWKVLQFIEDFHAASFLREVANPEYENRTKKKMVIEELTKKYELSVSDVKKNPEFKNNFLSGAKKY